MIEKGRKKYEKQKKSLVTKKYTNVIKKVCFILILSFCVLFLMKIKAHVVSGVSMAPTLENNDRLFVIKEKQPKRYSLITFSPTVNSSDYFVKRVIGMPGDRIWLDKNTVYLNHQMAADNQTPENELNLSGVDLPDGTLKVRVAWDTAAKLQGLSNIPEDKYFVLGDNRRNSIDSRKLGLIDSEQIEGVVFLRYYPLNKIGPID